MRCRRRCRTSAPIARSSRSVWSRVGAGSIDRGLAVGEQAGQQQRRLHLRAGDVEAMLDARAALAPARSPAAAGAHRRARRSRAPARRSGSTMRAIGRRRSEPSPLSTANTPAPGQHAAEQAHARARVAAVEHVGRLAQPAQADARDVHPIARRARSRRRAARRQPSVDAQSAPGEKLLIARLALAQRVEQRRAMRDGLVARHAQTAANARAPAATASLGALGSDVRPRRRSRGGLKQRPRPGQRPADRGQHLLELSHQLLEAFERQRLRPVRQRRIRLGVDLDDAARRRPPPRRPAPSAAPGSGGPCRGSGRR